MSARRWRGAVGAQPAVAAVAWLQGVRSGRDDRAPRTQVGCKYAVRLACLVEQGFGLDEDMILYGMKCTTRCDRAAHEPGGRVDRVGFVIACAKTACTPSSSTSWLIQDTGAPAR